MWRWHSPDGRGESFGQGARKPAAMPGLVCRIRVMNRTTPGPQAAVRAGNPGHETPGVIARPTRRDTAAGTAPPGSVAAVCLWVAVVSAGAAARLLDRCHLPSFWPRRMVPPDSAGPPPRLMG